MEKRSLPKGFYFRQADNRDVETARRIIWQVLLEYDLKPGNAELDADLEDIEKYYAQGYFGLIFNEQGKAVGTFALYPLHANTAEIRKMYLLPEVRRKGLGSWMIDFLLEKAQVLGFQKVELLTASVLQEAIQLYEKVGFTEVKDHTGGPRCDRAFMKSLVQQP